MHISGMMHVNVNCRDYERSRQFYELLGFTVMWEVPERNTPEVAAAVGMPPYLGGPCSSWRAHPPRR